MKKQPGVANVSVQLDEKIIDRIQTMRWKKHHQTLAAFIRAAVVTRVLEMERTPCRGWCDALTQKDDRAFATFYKRKRVRK